METTLLTRNLRNLMKEDTMGQVSDGYHTFDELYHHRAVLFSKLCNSNPWSSWKSKLHHDDTMYDGMFIVGINTPNGQATYHYDVDKYWDMFNVRILNKAPIWDGHTSDDAIARILDMKVDNIQDMASKAKCWDDIHEHFIKDPRLFEIWSKARTECADNQWCSMTSPIKVMLDMMLDRMD